MVAPNTALAYTMEKRCKLPVQVVALEGGLPLRACQVRNALNKMRNLTHITIAPKIRINTWQVDTLVAGEEYVRRLRRAYMVSHGLDFDIYMLKITARPVMRF